MKDDKDTFKDMMDEEYGKDVTGCVIPFLILAVVKTTDHYPKTIAITCFNSVCETVTAFTPGALINVTFDVESRSWTDPKTNVERWFTEAIARMVVPAVAQAPTMENFDKPMAPLNKEPEQNDLPF